MEWKLTKVTCCEPDEDVKPTYGKKCLLSEQGAFFPQREGTVEEEETRGGYRRLGGVAQPKGRNNCGGHRFTSGSVALFWQGGGPTPTLTIKGVSRLTGIFQRPAERKHTHRRLKLFFFPPFAYQVPTLHTANGITFHADLVSKRNFLNDDMLLKFTKTDWSH